MNKLFDILDEKEKKKLKKQTFPTWIGPMLATLSHEYFDDPDWIYERKLDGERILVYKNGKTVRLMTRNKKSANIIYPKLVAYLKNIPVKQFILDGEVVAFQGNISSFKKLKKVMHLRSADKVEALNMSVYYYVFDLLYAEGYNTTALPLRARKKLLKHLFDFHGMVRFTPHRNKTGIAYHKQACKKDWEGIIAKDSNGPYVSKRSKDWLKFKCINNQEFVIGGFTEPEGSRVGFGALLVGYYKGNKLMYAGKIGTGYTDQLLERLSKKLKKLEIKQSPFANFKKDTGGIHWVKPELVGQVEFTEWTSKNRLRHPSFQGLRDDKDPKDVVKES